MPNVLKITADGADDLLNTGAYGAGALIRVQTGATQGGAFADLTGTGSTPTIPLVALTYVYTGFDPSGISTSWYRTRYENAGGTRTSDWSNPFQAGGEEAGYLCSLYDVKEREGIDASNTSEDENILELIRQVSAEIERLCQRDFTGDRQDVTYYFDVSESSRTLRIPRGVQSVTTLGVATFSQPMNETGGIYQSVPAADFAIRPMIAERTWLGEPGDAVVLTDFPTGPTTFFFQGRNTVQLVGKLGWGAIPPEVNRIATTAVVSLHLTKGGDGPRVAIGPDGQMTILRDISPADWYTLQRIASRPTAWALGMDDLV